MKRPRTRSISRQPEDQRIQKIIAELFHARLWKEFSEEFDGFWVELRPWIMRQYGSKFDEEDQKFNLKIQFERFHLTPNWERFKGYCLIVLLPEVEKRLGSKLEGVNEKVLSRQVYAEFERQNGTDRLKRIAMSIFETHRMILALTADLAAHGKKFTGRPPARLKEYRQINDILQKDVIGKGMSPNLLQAVRRFGSKQRPKLSEPEIQKLYKAYNAYLNRHPRD